jgi:hypothetical protein
MLQQPSILGVRFSDRVAEGQRPQVADWLLAVVKQQGVGVAEILVVKMVDLSSECSV